IALLPLSTLFPYTTLFRSMIHSLGEEGLEVLDGLRPPTVEERLFGVLHHIPMIPSLHLMARNEDGKATRREDRAEREADQLAWRSEEHTSELQSRENLVCR